MTCIFQLNVDWFPPSEASLKRTLVQKLIFELLENRSREGTSAVCHNEHQSSTFHKNSENETVTDFLSERCGSLITQRGNLSNSRASCGIEINVLGATSARKLQCVNDSGLFLREFFEPAATAGALLEQYQSFGQPPSYFHLNGAISKREVLTLLDHCFIILFICKIIVTVSMTIDCSSYVTTDIKN